MKMPCSTSHRTCSRAASSTWSPIPNTSAGFLLTDPDGADGETARTVTVRTRPEPMPFDGGNVYHVYPPGYDGPREEPAFTGLLAAYYTGASGSDNFNTYPPRVRPGDTILVHAGLYRDNRYSYGGGMGTISSGTYFLTQSGTPERPIAIKAAGDGEAIFDGDGAYNLFNVMAANYNYFEGLTIRNTELAFQAGLKNIAGSSGLTLKNNRFEDIGRGVYTDWSGSKDYYIADNVFIGKFDPGQLLGFTGATWQPFNAENGPPALVSEYAVKVYGSGHVVAHNYVANFHDGIDVATYGNPDGTPNPLRDRMPVSIDFYGNDITHVEDNCIESDGGAHNIRIFRNRCFNHGHRALSVTTDVRRSGVFHPQSRLPRPRGGRRKVHGVFVGTPRLSQYFDRTDQTHAAGGVQRALPKQLDSGSKRIGGNLRRRNEHELFEFGLQRFQTERRRRVFVRMEHAAVLDDRQFPRRGRDADAPRTLVDTRPVAA